MKKRHRGGSPQAQQQSAADKPVTLKDLLDPATAAKLKAASESMQAEAARAKEEKRRLEEEARRAEQKRLENDFSYLLNQSNSADWKKFKS